MANETVTTAKEIKKAHSRFITNYLEYVYEGMLAFIILLIPDLVVQQKADLSIVIALGCFAIAIPFLTLCLIMIFYRRHQPTAIDDNWADKWRRFHPFVLTAALLSGFVGITSAFFHVNPYLGLLFFVSAGICFLIHHICVDSNG